MNYKYQKYVQKLKMDPSNKIYKQKLDYYRTQVSNKHKASSQNLRFGGEFETTCVICHDNLCQNDPVRVLPCNHYLHSYCESLLQQTECPNCREHYRPENVKNIHFTIESISNALNENKIAIERKKIRHEIELRFLPRIHQILMEKIIIKHQKELKLLPERQQLEMETTFKQYQKDLQNKQIEEYNNLRKKIIFLEGQIRFTDDTIKDIYLRRLIPLEKRPDDQRLPEPIIRERVIDDRRIGVIGRRERSEAMNFEGFPPDPPVLRRSDAITLNDDEFGDEENYIDDEDNYIDDEE